MQACQLRFQWHTAANSLNSQNSGKVCEAKAQVAIALRATARLRPLKKKRFWGRALRWVPLSARAARPPLGGLRPFSCANFFRGGGGDSIDRGEGGMHSFLQTYG